MTDQQAGLQPLTEQIAKISGTTLGYEDHGIFTLYLHVEYGASGQGVGGYALDQYSKAHEGRYGTAYGMEFIRRTMQACGVNSWESVKGRTIIVVKEGDEWNGVIVGIKPLPTEPGKPFMFEEIQEYRGYDN